VISIGNDSFLPEFLIAPTWNDSNPIWNKFLMKINPEDESNTRALSLRLTNDNDTFFYSPCMGFDLEKTPCTSWLSWHLLTTASGQVVQILKINPGTNLNDPKLDTSLVCPFRDFHVPRIDSLPRKDFRKRNFNRNRSNSPPIRRRRYDQDPESGRNTTAPQALQYYTPPQMGPQFVPNFFSHPMAACHFPTNPIPQMMYPLPPSNAK